MAPDRRPLRAGLIGLSSPQEVGVTAVLDAWPAGARAVRLASLESLRSAAGTAEVDLVVCGHDRGAFDSRDALAAARQAAPAIPVVVYAQAGDEDAAVRAMKEGAACYLPAPARLPEIQRAVSEALTRRHRPIGDVAKARFGALLDHLGIGTYRATPDGRLIDASETTWQLLRHPSRLALLQADVRLPIERRATLRRLLASSDVVRKVVQRVETPDGSAVMVEGDVHAVRDERGRLVCCDGYMRDVTERVDAMARLGFQALLLAHVRHVVIAVDGDLRLAHWNPFAEHLFDRSAADVVGGRLADAIGAVDAAFVAGIERSLVADGHWEGTIDGRTNNGERLALQTVAAAFASGGRSGGYLITMIDVTAQRRLERRLETALADRERLLHDVHHRVKRNLITISSVLRLQGGAQSDPSARALFRESEQRIAAIALIHDWLAPRGDGNDANLGEYLVHLVDRLWASYRDRGWPRVACDADDVAVPPDTAVRIGLIVNELVTNALRHAFAGRDSGLVSVVVRRGPRHDIVLTVCDDGIGLPESLDVATTPTLGLQLVRNLAASLGADLDIDRCAGTAATVRIPLQGARA